MTEIRQFMSWHLGTIALGQGRFVPREFAARKRIIDLNGRTRQRFRFVIRSSITCRCPDISALREQV